MEVEKYAKQLFDKRIRDPEECRYCGSELFYITPRKAKCLQCDTGFYPQSDSVDYGTHLRIFIRR